MREAPILVIIRHAHRDIDRGRRRDNGLSKKGKQQALALRKFFRFRFGKNPDVTLLSSPKKRCLETLDPIADMVGNEIEVHSALDEQQPGESVRAFEKRLERFYREWKKSKAWLTVICTHGDWIPMATKKITRIPIHLSKGGWMEFSGKSKSELVWLVQRFD